MPLSTWAWSSAEDSEAPHTRRAKNLSPLSLSSSIPGRKAVARQDLRDSELERFSQLLGSCFLTRLVIYWFALLPSWHVQILLRRHSACPGFPEQGEQLLSRGPRRTSRETLWPLVSVASMDGRGPFSFRAFVVAVRHVTDQQLRSPSAFPLPVQGQQRSCLGGICG